MGSTITGSLFKDKLIKALNIPMELTDHKDINLGYAWQKYKGFLTASKTCNVLWDSGKLQGVFDKRPTQGDIISVFKGKSQWHLTYQKAFPRVSGYPTMVSWLEDGDDKLSDVELWGVSKPVYGFSDLFEWLANGGEGLTVETESDMKKSKGKGKEKAKEKKKDKGKEKKKRTGKEGVMEEKNEGQSKRKEKGKEKEVSGGKNKKKAKGNL